jgi:bifunctional non-homologous end joining protein LigD
VGLDTYRRKRTFVTTPEPSGTVSAEGGHPRFVVQEHHARRVHWDLRLEMEGVLRSWAIPKAPSLDPADKRLAVLVEDHPIEYGEFEGVIPAGNYGAGTVMLWDRGLYESLEGDPAAAFRQGKMTLVLFGEKVRGEFHFVRTKRNAGRDWLLFKGNDDYARAGFIPTGTRSVKTGRTIEEIRADRDARWTPGAPPTPAPVPADPTPAPVGAHPEPAPVSADPTSRSLPVDPFPGPFKPMLAQTADRAFNRAGWLFEIKWDGVRTLGFMRRLGAAQEVRLYSRTLRSLNPQFPEIVEALAGLDAESAVLDGEIIAPEDGGRPSFARLQQRLHLEDESDVREAAERIPVTYAVFDLLYLNGRDLSSLPLSERRRALEALVLPPGMIRSDTVEQEGLTLFEAAQQHGLEGIVGKKAASPYRAGVRDADWQKIKIRKTLEAVVGGMTRGKGHRSGTFGALILGQYDPLSGAFVHIGQTGGGLSDGDLRDLRRRLEPLITTACPFATPPATLQPPTWVRPEVVVEVEYGERTPDGLLRFPVFLRARDDLAARDVRLPPPPDAADDGAEREAPSVPDPRPVPATVDASSADGTTDPPSVQAIAETRQPPQGEPVGRRPARSARKHAAPAAAVAFTNLDKIFFPELGLTKGDLIDYYRRIAPIILPHLRDRPLSLRRFPNGIHGSDFFQKDVPDTPPFVRTERIWSDQGDRDIRMVICNDEATLLWLAQLGCIEMHPWFSRLTPVPGRGRDRPGTAFSGSEEAIGGSTLNSPDFVVFDIDPFLFPPGQGPTRRHGELDPDYSRRGFEAARQAALWLGDTLEALGLRGFVKTSGKTGLHVFVPIVRRFTYAQTHAFAKTVTAWLSQQHPEALTTAWAVPERLGRVFLDYNQNIRGKTLASIYSVRPVPEATVSMPVTWEELRTGFDPLVWTTRTVFDRLARVGDLWANILEAGQGLELKPQ